MSVGRLVLALSEGWQLFGMMSIFQAFGSPKIRAALMDEVDEGKAHYI
jgi:hypothetical protein